MFSGAGPLSAANGGSPSDRGDAAPVPLASAPVSMPASESTVARGYNGHDIQENNSTASPQSAVSQKKRRGARAVGPDKNGRGLRQFSMRVCEKVESKGITTYNEVADELVAEFSNLNSNVDSPDHDNPSSLQFDEKNIRRRVYDALNVLRAMDIISKDKKEIQWRGLPKTTVNDIEELKTEVIKSKHRIEMKKAYVKDLQEQYACVRNLIQRNQQLYVSGNEPSSRMALPFTLVQTHRGAHVEVELSTDFQSVHMDFNSTPFDLYDGNFVTKAMGLWDNKETECIEAHVLNGGECSSTPNNYWPQSVQPLGPSVWVPNSHPTPGILKGGRAKQGNNE